MSNVRIHRALWTRVFGLRDRTDRHQGYNPFYVHGPVILLPFLVFATELTGTKGKNYPFYVHRPVILLPFLVFATELTGTKGKNYPFTYTDLCVQFPRTLAPLLTLAQTDWKIPAKRCRT